MATNSELLVVSRSAWTCSPLTTFRHHPFFKNLSPLQGKLEGRAPLWESPALRAVWGPPAPLAMTGSPFRKHVLFLFSLLHCCQLTPAEGFADICLSPQSLHLEGAHEGSLAMLGNLGWREAGEVPQVPISAGAHSRVPSLHLWALRVCTLDASVSGPGKHCLLTPTLGKATSVALTSSLFSLN